MTEFETKEEIVRAFDRQAPDKDDFETVEEFKDWVDTRFAEIQAVTDLLSDRVDSVEQDVDEVQEQVENVAKTSALGRKELHDEIETLRFRMDYLGGDREVRVRRLAKALYNRCTTDDGISYVTVTETTITAGRTTHKLNGVHEMFNEDFTVQTCRDYMASVAERFEGCYIDAPTPGGWSGGKDKKKLKMNVDEFVGSHADEFGLER